MVRIRFVLLVIVLFTGVKYAFSQAPAPVRSAQKQLLDSLCNCISKADIGAIRNKSMAMAVFSDCFSSQAELIKQVAAENNIAVTDQAGMNKLGNLIGQNLLKQNCSAAMQLSMKMTDNGQPGGDETLSSVVGKFQRVETHRLSYIVIIDENKKESSFLWLRQFPGSEKFMNGTQNLTNKKLRVEYHDVDIYLPEKKSYSRLREITDVTFL